MSDYYDERVPGADYHRQVYLRGVTDGLEITVDNVDEEVTILLSGYGVRELRLALARYERLTAKLANP